MKWRTLRFRARASEAPAVEKAIIAFVAKVADEPGTLRYESFREPDGVSYVHLMGFSDAAAEQAHQQTDHLKKFLADLSPRCDQPPVFADLKMISGSGR